MSRYIEAVITGRRPLTERTVELQISAADGSAFQLAEAGSHIELRFGHRGRRFLRHYSIVGPLSPSVEREPFWRIAVQRENRARGSAFIHDSLYEGAKLTVSTPITAFRLARNKAHMLLVAGGIGITPILPMIRSLLVRNASFSVLYAGVERSRMVYIDEVAAMCGDRLQMHESSADGTPNLKQVLQRQPPGTMAYVCGPAPMVDGLRTAAAELLWDKQRVRFEIFNSAHRPEDKAFEVHLKSGRVITVGAGTTILDALEHAGVDTLSDCRRGECGLCVTDAAEPFSAIDHRDNYLSAEERSGSRQMCICCSRPKGTRLDLDIA